MRRRQPQVANAEGKVKRVAEYIQDEFPVPRGRPSGHMLLKEDRKLAAIVLSVAQAVWFITIAVGIIFYAGDPTGAEKHAFHSLVWFDHLLRSYGPIFPFLFLATRYKLASLAPDVLDFDNQPWVEQIVIYIGITVTRLTIYFIHRLEAVLLARDIRHAAQRLAPLEQSLLVGTFLFCSLLFFLIDGDMYYTCRFYHAPIQNFWAVILGIVVFQLPLSWWLIRGNNYKQSALLLLVETVRGFAQDARSGVAGEVYATIGHNACLEARPSVVHFGGFTVGSVHEQRIRLCNTSSSSTGTHIILPTTPYFKAYCDNKKGSLAPGLEDVITVEFCPTEWRYYYDCLQIHSQGGNLLIPIHAYPMMNQTKFPRRISFGKCAVGETYTKRVNLTCNVPIEFEYEITMLEASAAFTVQPQHGVVPANGVVEVQVTFNPSRLVTEVVELEIRVAEFQSETVRCTVSGSGFPGLARQHQLAGLTASLGSTLPEEAPIWGKAKTGRLPKGTITTGKGGAGGGDAYTRLQTQKQQQGGPRDSRITGPIKAKLPALRPPTPPSKIEGLVVPAHPNQQAHMAMLLNQQPGKLMLSDIQVAIEEKKKLLAEKEATLRRTLGRSKDTSLDPLDDSSLPRETKADLFEYLCLEAQQHRRDVELNALEPQVGSDPLTPPQLAQIQEARKQHQQQAAANQRQAAVHRTAVEMQAAAASTVRPRQQAGQTTADASSSEGPAGTRFVEEAAGASATAQPRWDCNDGDTWHKRQQALHRFAQAGRKVIHRARAARRLALISTLVQNLKDPQSSQTLDHRNAIAG
ncbi:TPA: hypothetical protein ACH3X2_004621 [Trebouxia sp. C0005]